MNIAWTNFLRFIFAIQSIFCTVLSTSYVFRQHIVGFPNLSQWTYFSGEFVFMVPVLQYFGNWSRKLHSNLFKVLHQIDINQTFGKNVNAAVLGNIMKRKTKIPQSDFPNYTGIYFSEYALCFFIIVKYPMTISSKYEFKWLICY